MIAHNTLFRQRCLWIGWWCLIAAAPVVAQERASFRPILEDQYARYPQMTVQDLYKLIHQAALGSEHAVTDAAAARRWMDREVASLGDGPPEPLPDPLTPDERLVRVHLRPFLAAGGSPDALVDAFVRTANTYHGSSEQIDAYWREAEAMAASGALPFHPDTMAVFMAAMKEAGYPAVHHSDAYNAAYRPAYRVVAIDYMPGLKDR